MRASLLILSVVVLAGPPGSASAQELTGKPEIITGDSLSVAGRRLRLYGIDAPEAGQSCRLGNGKSYDCGLVSKTALIDLTAGVAITCRLRDGKSDTFPYATCFAGGYDLSHGMAHTGWALAFPRDIARYRRAEERAHKARRGLWRGAFVVPWRWRDGARLAPKPGN